MFDSLTIRATGAEDALALLELAMLDSADQLEGEVLLAEVHGELWAAVEVASDRAIADPFRPSAQAVELLRARALTLRNELYAGPARWSTPRRASARPSESS